MGTTRNSSHFRLILTRFIFDKGVKIEEEKTVRLLSAIAVALGLLATQTASALMPEKDSLSDLTTYQAQWLVEQGVEPAKARSLALEVEYGNPLDSMSGAEPISTQTSEEHGWILTRSEFADGSVSVSMLQTPGAELTDFSPRAVGSCGSTTSGSYWVQYTDCLVYGSNGYLQVGFHTNYYRGSGGSGISSVFSPLPLGCRRELNNTSCQH